MNMPRQIYISILQFCSVLSKTSATIYHAGSSKPLLYSTSSIYGFIPTVLHYISTFFKGFPA